MIQFVTLLPTLLATLLIAWSVRFAARMMGLKNVTWKLCLAFALILLLIAFVRTASGLTLSGYVPPLAAFALGIAFSLAIGAWLFGKHVLDPAGHPLGWRIGAKLMAAAFLVMCAPAGVLLAIAGIVRG